MTLRHRPALLFWVWFAQQPRRVSGARLLVRSSKPYADAPIDHW